MIPLIQLLYKHTMEHWHTACRVLDDREDVEYHSCRLKAEQQEEALLRSLSGEERKLFERYVENSESAGETTRLLCFCRGLSMGVFLGSLGREG